MPAEVQRIINKRSVGAGAALIFTGAAMVNAGCAIDTGSTATAEAPKTPYPYQTPSAYATHTPEATKSQELLNSSLIKLGQEYFNGTPNWVTAKTSFTYDDPTGKPFTAGEIYKVPQSGEVFLINEVIGGEQINNNTAIVLIPTHDSKGNKVILVVQFDTVKYGNPFWSGNSLIPGLDGPLNNGKTFQQLITENNSTVPNKDGELGTLASIYFGQINPADIQGIIDHGTLQQGVIRTSQELANLTLADITKASVSTPTPTSSSRGAVGPGSSSDTSTTSLDVLTGNFINVPRAHGTI